MDSHDVRKGVDIEFADGKTRTIRPLTIKALRRFVKVIDKLQNPEEKEDSSVMVSDNDLTLMVEAASIVLEKEDPELAADTDTLEDTLDLLTFNEIMNVAMGASSPEM